MSKIKSFWKKITIKNKITLFTGTVFLTILVAIVFDAILIRLFVIDVNDIMEDNSKGGEIVANLDKEKDLFNAYINNNSLENRQALLDSFEATKKALSAVPLDYDRLGENRYAQLFSLRTCYDVYCKYRDEIVDAETQKYDYVSRLYAVYTMQDYLIGYAQKFVDLTLKDGNAKYRELIPTVFAVPLIAVTLSIFLFSAVLEISRMMNKAITEPVLKLANASRRIAANDFYIDDVEADNEDELGELVKAFNKMKYATGEYIEALEQRREALDKLHAKEVETLEAEKQLDAMNLELLKNQINPHFLFNTLNVIGGMANLEGAGTTEQMIKALSSLFRYNLKNQAKEVLLSQELKVAEDYMYLQKMRFGDRVKYEVNCEVDADNVMVPTFTLQPIIENCIIHGISPKIEGGCVSLDISKKGDELVIAITDTGRGMSKETLDLILKSLGGSDNNSVGIGMGNIYRRIKGMYDESDMRIISSEGEGTTITVTIPYLSGDVD
ncbi:sensor histidine kinase [Butyrivibrio sp. X503]|uniref:sensor histidine kinase n=1 Tax=Butyrivibrio sp. X503 TaxID=2364878 RepID=UPI000EA8D6F0|nr:sensor histidine kinase [Butyrivibrio sp. X503]RKM53909.1 sensor histidine kinase [Butyrivibrio sp. X503]